MTYFTESKRGYSKAEVTDFIRSLNEEHAEKLKEKDAIIKSLLSENELLRGRISDMELNPPQESEAPRPVFEAAPAPVPAAAAEDINIKAKYEKLCSEMGEKFIFADNQAKEIIAAANAESSEIMSKARKEAAELVKKILEEAKENSRTARRATEIYEQKHSQIAASLDQARAQLDEMIGAVAKLTHIDGENE